MEGGRITGYRFGGGGGGRGVTIGEVLPFNISGELDVAEGEGVEVSRGVSTCETSPNFCCKWCG